MGLSEAVSSLSIGNTADPEALQSSINELTGGLGIAFDTTLLGLILSILLSFPLSAVQKREDETLTLIDAFCTEKLLPKLNDSKASSNDSILEQANTLPELVGSLARAHESFLVHLNDATTNMNNASQTMIKNHITMQESFHNAISELSGTSSQLFLKSDKELNNTFKHLAIGIDEMNKSLKKLGGEQIPSKKRQRSLRR